jgi:hypothetical protein
MEIDGLEGLATAAIGVHDLGVLRNNRTQVTIG